MQDMYEQRISTQGKEPRAAMNLEGQGSHEGSENGRRGIEVRWTDWSWFWYGGVCVGPDGIQGGGWLDNRNLEDQMEGLKRLCNFLA